MQSSIAIVDSHYICAVGLQQVLQSLLPATSVLLYSNIERCIADIERTDGKRPYFVYFFVEDDALLPFSDYFSSLTQLTIVISNSLVAQNKDFPIINVMAGEFELMQQILNIHAQSSNLKSAKSDSVLSLREIDVLKLVAKGFINKEIADYLCISLNTVITHRTHITEKLGLKSLPALTVYAIINGYVDYNDVYGK